MADPVLHLIVGPNGAGKSSLFGLVLEPITDLPFVNADLIAAERWPNEAEARAYEAAGIAAATRAQLIAERRSFAAETVFSHPSKLELLNAARTAGYVITLHVVAVSEDLAVARVANRVDVGGHSVPEEKVRERFARLWPLVVQAIALVDEALVYDNSGATQPFRVVARFRLGRLVSTPAWPPWAPAELVAFKS